MSHKDYCSWWKSESISQFGWREIRGDHHIWILPKAQLFSDSYFHLLSLLTSPAAPGLSCWEKMISQSLSRLKCQGVKQSPGGHSHLEECWPQVCERWVQPWLLTDQLWDCGCGTPPSHLSWLSFPSDKSSTQACVCRKGTISACVTGKSMSWGRL